MIRRRSQVIRPAERPAQEPLPLLVPGLALVGLVVLCFCALPAAMEQHRLSLRHQRAQAAAHDVQRELEQRRHQLRASSADAFGRLRRLRQIESQGRRHLREREEALRKAAWATGG